MQAYFMNQNKLDRINELARKSRTEEGLTEEEKAEQALLRSEYISAFKASLRGQLDNIVFVEKDGSHTPLTKKDDILH